MGELTVTTFLTLDGVMQAPGGPTEDPSGGFAHGGWVAPYFDDDMGRIIDANFGHADAFLLGRTTYDIFSSYWPQYPNQDEIVAKSLNNLPKFVASRTRTSFDWSGTSHIADVVREVAALKERFAREVQVHGAAASSRPLSRTTSSTSTGCSPSRCSSGRGSGSLETAPCRPH